jgi:hypothetical protein
MHHRVKALEIRFRQIADVFANLWNVLSPFTELAAGKQICVQADNLMAGGTQYGSRNGADIASMASQ